LSTNITGTPGGTWSGQGVSANGQFNPQGLSGSIPVTYTVGQGACSKFLTQNITITQPSNASWTVPSALCANSPAINLNTNVTGTSGGTWTGQGVSSNGQFNPQGLSGSIAITYSVGSGACAAVSTQNITVIQNADATWTVPPPICSNASAINLNVSVTGTSGGTWSGQGVSANGQFNPQGLSGSIAITYSVGTGSCAVTSTQNITVIPSADAAWTVPSPLCANSPAINLNTSVTGTPGGTWSGQGVNAAGLFNPSGLSGLISVTYSVGTGDCSASSPQDILVKPLPPEPLTSGNATYCEGESIEPITASGLSGATFNWYSDSGLNNLIFTGSPYAANSNTDDLWVTQTLDGCEGPASFVTIIINAVPPPPPVQNQFIYCLGQSFPLLSVNADPAAVVNWYSDSGLNNIIFTGNPYQPANNLFNEFWITQTVNNCTSGPSFTSIVADSILVDFTVSDSIGVYPFFIELNNLSQNSANCFWYVNNQIKEEFSSDSYTFEEKGIYKITLSCVSANGCKSEKTIIITVLPPETTIYIPNTFSPNQDRTNDLFQVYGVGIDEYFMQIFNRWGELIYQSYEIEKGWDGKVARTEMIAPQDVYVYKIFIQDIMKRSATFYGRITLIK
jgi:gliding motility-associated-like protein